MPKKAQKPFALDYNKVVALALVLLGGGGVASHVDSRNNMQASVASVQDTIKADQRKTWAKHHDEDVARDELMIRQHDTLLRLLKHSTNGRH